MAEVYVVGVQDGDMVLFRLSNRLAAVEGRDEARALLGPILNQFDLEEAVPRALTARRCSPFRLLINPIPSFAVLKPASWRLPFVLSHTLALREAAVPPPSPLPPIGATGDVSGHSVVGVTHVVAKARRFLNHCIDNGGSDGAVFFVPEANRADFADGTSVPAEGAFPYSYGNWRGLHSIVIVPVSTVGAAIRWIDRNYSLSAAHDAAVRAFVSSSSLDAAKATLEEGRTHCCTDAAGVAERRLSDYAPFLFGHDEVFRLAVAALDAGGAGDARAIRLAGMEGVGKSVLTARLALAAWEGKRVGLVYARTNHAGAILAALFEGLSLEQFLLHARDNPSHLRDLLDFGRAIPDGLLIVLDGLDEVRGDELRRLLSLVRVIAELTSTQATARAGTAVRWILTARPCLFEREVAEALAQAGVRVSNLDIEPERESAVKLALARRQLWAAAGGTPSKDVAEQLAARLDHFKGSVAAALSTTEATPYEGTIRRIRGNGPATLCAAALCALDGPLRLSELKRIASIKSDFWHDDTLGSLQTLLVRIDDAGEEDVAIRLKRFARLFLRHPDVTCAVRHFWRNYLAREGQAFHGREALLEELLALLHADGTPPRRVRRRLLATLDRIAADENSKSLLLNLFLSFPVSKGAGMLLRKLVGSPARLFDIAVQWMSTLAVEHPQEVFDYVRMTGSSRWLGSAPLLCCVAAAVRTLAPDRREPPRDGRDRYRETVSFLADLVARHGSGMPGAVVSCELAENRTLFWDTMEAVLSEPGTRRGRAFARSMEAFHSPPGQQLVASYATRLRATRFDPRIRTSLHFAWLALRLFSPSLLLAAKRLMTGYRVTFSDLTGAMLSAGNMVAVLIRSLRDWAHDPKRMKWALDMPVARILIATGSPGLEDPRWSANVRQIAEVAGVLVLPLGFRALHGLEGWVGGTIREVTKEDRKILEACALVADDPDTLLCHLPMMSRAYATDNQFLWYVATCTFDTAACCQDHLVSLLGSLKSNPRRGGAAGALENHLLFNALHLNPGCACDALVDWIDSLSELARPRSPLRLAAGVNARLNARAFDATWVEQVLLPHFARLAADDAEAAALSLAPLAAVGSERVLRIWARAYQLRPDLRDQLTRCLGMISMLRPGQVLAATQYQVFGFDQVASALSEADYQALQASLFRVRRSDRDLLGKLDLIGIHEAIVCCCQQYPGLRRAIVGAAARTVPGRTSYQDLLADFTEHFVRQTLKPPGTTEWLAAP